MVLLAVMHMFYQYFAGRYKLRYEILWVTGIILGVVTIIEAYTGYDLIFNIRGQLAINIGQTLTYYTPVLGANLAQIDRKSTRLNSSHQIISYAVFCLKKKKII